MTNGTDSTIPLPSPALRRLSKAAFGRESQAEVVLAAEALPKRFTFEQVNQRVVQAAGDAGLEPPSEAAVRKDLTRMRECFGALRRQDRERGVLTYTEERRASALWRMCRELAELAERDG